MHFRNELQPVLAVTILLISIFITGQINAKNLKSQEPAANSQPDTLAITQWLTLGPIPTALPAFHEDKTAGFDLKKLLKYEPLDVNLLCPQEGETVNWLDSELLTWKVIRADSDSSALILGKSDSSQYQMAYLAAYVESKQWIKADISVTSSQTLQIYFNGREIGTKASYENNQKGDESPEAGRATGKIELETGKHLLLIKTIYSPDSKVDWTLKACIVVAPEFAGVKPNIDVCPTHVFQIRQLLDGPKLGDVSISPDGKLVAVNMHQTMPPDDNSESWIEIRRTSDGALEQTFRGGIKISDLNWAPDGAQFSYKSTDKKGSDLWLLNLRQGTAIQLLKNIEELGSHTWSPEGSFIVYSITEKPEKDKRGVKRLKGLPDRQHYWRDRSTLYRVSVPGGITQRLTAGEFSTNIAAIHPDGKSMLFTVSEEDYSERPYGKTTLFSLDFKTLEATPIWKGNWLNSVSWSPDASELLVLGGPSMFGKLGQNVPEGTVPNDYDTQAYILDLTLQHGKPITLHFEPSINSAVWHKNGNIYFYVTEGEYRPLYQYEAKNKKFTRIDTGTDVLNRVSCARNAPHLVYTGANTAAPPKLYHLNLKNNKFNVIYDPEQKTFENVLLGNIEPWNFNNKRGTKIQGRIYYPPDFSPDKQYPCIVYYYGGTSPVTRDFGGRYPKNLWAAQGYVVYVLQPSGAVGYGQAFSALHVNDWGIIVADEIIDGVNQFLADHPFIDKKRVGCIGASFGGFMTQLLLTKTDIFSAAVSHAGISMIPSYWGEGYWGYSYSAVATANSFPWNRKDIYVNQSPLFSADKITTPLLLTHGASDTNVPPGESEQIYTALKLLGKEVEYLKIEDQNHWIMEYNKRIIWTKSIIAWFDKWLKNQPAFWNALYGDKNE
ncbi:S9 family peptidase [candidate division KSB1 bacterium]|nr:S9 family peptidase [candidate division KSB1 bacterium]